MKVRNVFASVAVVTLLAIGCGTTLDDVLGDVLGSTGTRNPSDVQGVVQRIDPNQRLIELDVRTVNRLRDARPGSIVYWDSNTRVRYQGNTYRPEDLERGDEIAVRGVNRNGRYFATDIEVVRDATPY